MTFIRERGLAILTVLILAVPTLRPLLKSGYFSMHDDIQVMRLYQMEQCIKYGQIPCRWVPDMGAGYGHPLFNYHQPFPYYLGMVFRLLGFSFIDTVKILFGLTFLISSIGIYFLAKEIWGEKEGLVASIVFLYGPYRAVDVFVRGALTEIWGITFFPLIFLGLYRFVKEEKKRWFLLSILSLTGLFLSHNIMTLLFAPVSVLWALILIQKFKKKKLIFRTGLIFIWAFCLASFFVLPAFLEKNLVTMETLTGDYYDYQNRFATFRQLFVDRSFGFGPSRIGPEDGMSFQLGWPHWWLVGFSFFWWLYKLFKAKIKSLDFLIILPLMVWCFSVFMTHSKSYYVWKIMPVFRFVQFPWRWLG